MTTINIARAAGVRFAWTAMALAAPLAAALAAESASAAATAVTAAGAGGAAGAATATTSAAGLAEQAVAAGIHAEPYGVGPRGIAVERVTLTNDRGMQLSYIDYGAILVAATVADRHGKRANIVLGAPDLAGYMKSNRRYGAIMGRYAGRIGNARFTLDGKEYLLTPGSKGFAIHGDPDGIDRRVWSRTDFADLESVGSTYKLISPDGDQGMPGTMEIAVTYRLMRKVDEFRIEYAARSDKATVVNLTNHAYFNLSGAGTRGLASHRFQFDADRYVAADEKKVPTGELPSVAGTPFDFRQSAGAAARLAIAAHSETPGAARGGAAGEAGVAGAGRPHGGVPPAGAAPGSATGPAPGGLPGATPGYDHGFVFNKPAGVLAKVAVIDDLASGRRMEVHTTEPSAQFYTANAFDGQEMGAEGRAYERFDGFAFETQHLADSPNKPNFPSTILRPGEEFRSVTIFRFSRTSAPQ